MDVFAPDEAVVPVVVTEILVGLPRPLRFGGIVTTARQAVVRSGCGENGCALVKKERDVALEVDGITGVNACGEENRASPRAGRAFDSGIDRCSVDGSAIALGAVGA